MEKKIMSTWGIGPAYVGIITLCTVVAMIPVVREKVQIDLPGFLRTFMLVFGIFLIVIGVHIWMQAALKSKLHDNIRAGKLVKDGVYAYVRNPIYSAFMLVQWGIIMVSANPLIAIAIPLYWILMTVMVKATEEKWLLEAYGDHYIIYCMKVNRCIPWIKK